MLFVVEENTRVMTDSPNTQHLRHIRSTTQTAESRQADGQSLLHVWSSVWPSASLWVISSQDIMSLRRRASHLHIIACLLLNRCMVFALLTQTSAGEARAYTKLMNMLRHIARKLHW